MGAGKTSVSEVLVEKIDKNDVCVLDLDITDSHGQRFNENLKDCLRYNNVIGMMFYGNSHTTDPMRWIVNFNDAGYNILSVILFCSKVMCFDRCINDNYNGRHPINEEKNRLGRYNDEFYQREMLEPFHKIADVREIRIETANRSQAEIAEDILKNFNTIFPSY